MTMLRPTTSIAQSRRPPSSTVASTSRPSRCGPARASLLHLPAAPRPRKREPQLTELSSWTAGSRPSLFTSTEPRASLPPRIRPVPRLVPAVRGDPGTEGTGSRTQSAAATRTGDSGPTAVGPRPVPGSLAVVAHELAAVESDPAALAALLVRCLLVRAQDRKLGGEMVTLLLHPSCFVTDHGERRVRPRVIKRLQRFGSSRIARSYVQGANSSNNYQVDLDAVVVLVDGVAIAAGADDRVQVQLKVSGGMEAGAESSRMVAIRRVADGACRVVDFGGLARQVLPPLAVRRDEVPRAAAGSTHAGYEAPIATFRPVPVYRPLGDRNCQPLSRENPQQRQQRQHQARKDLEFLAARLAVDEINRDIEANPSKPRVVCSFRNGVIALRALLPGARCSLGVVTGGTITAPNTPLLPSSSVAEHDRVG